MDGVKLTGLWKRESSKGGTFLAGKAGTPDDLIRILQGEEFAGKGVSVMVFKNSYKTTDSQPDYQVYLVPHEAKPRETAPAAGDAQDPPADTDHTPARWDLKPKQEPEPEEAYLDGGALPF